MSGEPREPGADSRARRRRVLLLLPPALVALTVLATGPLWAVGEEPSPDPGPFDSQPFTLQPESTGVPSPLGAQDSPTTMPLSLTEPVAAPSPAAGAAPFAAGPKLSIQPPPPPRSASGGRSSSRSSGAFTCPAGPSAYPGASGSAFRTAINKERARNGLNALSWSSSMASSAQNWSEAMAAADVSTPGTLGDGLAHGGGGYSGQNVGFTTGSASTVHTAFMRSTGHCKNIIKSGWTHVGVGIAKVSILHEGHTYTVTYITVNFS